MAFIGDFDVQILLDAVHPGPGPRLTTMQLTYPRCIHSEFMTHRMFSRNSASSRAIPIEKMLQNVEESPFVPIYWGLNQKGMQAGGEHSEIHNCESTWLAARDAALYEANRLNRLGLHKQIVNRVLEPWMWITVIATGIEPAWENFFKLRCHPDAEPHIQKIAYMAREQYDANGIWAMTYDHDYTPLIGFDGDENLTRDEKRKVSTARCARVSYRTHDGERDVSADIALHDRLCEAGHWSPFEHVAKPINSSVQPGTSNFGPYWLQYRKMFPNEMCEKAPRDHVESE